MKTNDKLTNELIDAYLKFKSYVYHENFSVGLKKEISKFELHFEKRIKKLSVELQKIQQGQKSSYLSSCINRISYLILPKSFATQDYEKFGGSFYTNKNIYSSYKIEDIKNVIPFINCEIELHIIATLWVVKIGVRLDKKLSNTSYANRLYDLKSRNYDDKLKLFKKYFINYNNWRDSAISAAQKIHKEGDNVAILNLDIQNYYHSIDLDLSKYFVTKNLKWLNSILIEIHRSYISILKENGIIDKQPKKIIPIGLTSSNILANFYLDQLDSTIIQKTKPEFYGRYVDDFLIVYRNPVINEKKSDVVFDFITKNISEKTKNIEKAYLLPDETKESFKIIIDSNQLNLQLKKVKLYYFVNTDNINLLEEFKKEIQKNSSEFKLQLEEEELKNPFEETTYRINYSDTINKLRSIDSFSPNKFGASKQISKIIGSSKYLSDNSLRKTSEISKKINEYFKGKRSLEMYSLWEKTFSFFVITKDEKGLLLFSEQVLKSISQIEFKLNGRDKLDNDKLSQDVKNSLTSHLINSFATAAALNIKFFSANILKEIKSKSKEDIKIYVKALNLIQLKRAANEIIQANLLRHSFCFYPLLNYCNQNSRFSFASSELSKQTNFELNEKKIQLSPRFVNFYEVELFNFIKYKIHNKIPEELYKKDEECFNRKCQLKLNSKKSLKKSNFNDFISINNLNLKTLVLDNSKKINNVKIGLVNIKVDLNNNQLSLEKKPNLSLIRLNELNKILNEAIKCKVDLIVFPEISIPFQWVSKLTDYSKRNNLGIICGLEHIVSGNEAYNYVCTILPFKDGMYNNTHLDIRLKKDYAPEEIEKLLNNYKLIQPHRCKTEKLRLYKWRGVFFSVLNCFELSDIDKRALFRGKVDFIFTVEYNRDVNYFSNITESFARDIHAYTIQVNSSQFGDSRITLPVETKFKDNARIKGGENVSLLVGDLDIKALRAFQNLSYTDQLKHKDLFKPIPPNFNISEDRK